MIRRPRLAALLLGVALVSACGTTVPTAQQQIVGGTSGASGPSGTVGLGTGGSTTGGLGSGAGATTGTSTGGATGGSAAIGTAGASTVGGSTGSGAPAPSAADAAGIPKTGPGWDATHVYIGVPTADDFNSTVKAAGAATSNGDVHGDIDAIVSSLNKSGGVLGRQLVAVYHDAKTTDYAYNPSATAQQMCTYFTQDRPVVAVINGTPQLDGADNFHTCLEHAKISLLSLSNTDYADADYQRLGPHLWTTASLSTDVLVPTFVAALARQSFFTGWDSLNGSTGPAPVKVGALLPDNVQGHHVASLMTPALKKVNLNLDSVFWYDPTGLGSKSQAEVLQFKSANITHVLDLPPVAAEVWLFQAAAEKQQYRPRYGFTSFDLPLSIEENSNIVPPRQQIGSLGIGWQPFNDTNSSHDPGLTSGGKRCLAALAQGGQTFDGSQRRGALIAVQICDAFTLLRDALRDGRGF
nr:hypothetical protein [Actinomycetota bacterium]